MILKSYFEINIGGKNHAFNYYAMENLSGELLVFLNIPIFAISIGN